MYRLRIRIFIFKNLDESSTFQKIFKRTDTFWMTQQALWSKNHQRFAERESHLASQNVKEVGGRSAVDYLHIVIGTKSQETFNTCRSMFRSLSFMSVGQHQYNTVHALPFSFWRSNELINNYLRTVSKISKLRFPDCKRVWRSIGIAVFKTKNTIFRKKGIIYFKCCLIFRKMIQGDVFWVVLCRNDGMSLCKCPSPWILSA